jgi:hypothetical protein
VTERGLQADFLRSDKDHLVRALARAVQFASTTPKYESEAYTVTYVRPSESAKGRPAWGDDIPTPERT